MKHSRSSRASRVLVMLAMLATLQPTRAQNENVTVMPADPGTTVTPAEGFNAASSDGNTSAGNPPPATEPPVMTQPPTITQVSTEPPTEAPTEAPVVTQAPTPIPTPPPIATEPPTAAPVDITPVPSALIPTLTPIVPPPLSPPDSSPREATQSPTNNEVDTSTSKIGTPEANTFSPISSNDGDNDTTAESDTDTSDSGSEPTKASTSSGESSSFGGWKLAIVIGGAACAVVASILLVRMRPGRPTTAIKHTRGSPRQRALGSFFRQNPVTVAREAGFSSSNYVTDPLTPRDEIVVTIPSNMQQVRPDTKTADLSAVSPMQALNNNNQSESNVGPGASIETPTESCHGDAYNSFTGKNQAPSMMSEDSSSSYPSNSVYSDTSSVSLGSIAPSEMSSQNSYTPLGLSVYQSTPRLEAVGSQSRYSKQASSIGGGRDTDRSCSDFSNASTDDDIYRITTQLDASAIPAITSERSDLISQESYSNSDRMSDFSVNESYTFDLSIHERFATEISIDDDDRLTDNSQISRNSEETELRGRNLNFR